VHVADRVYIDALYRFNAAPGPDDALRRDVVDAVREFATYTLSH
jgi:hypothetical protein